MKICKDFPPNYTEIKEAFNPSPEVVYTYGDVIYSPLFTELPADLIAHEEVHSRQQIDPKEWWNKYLKDKDFRVEQEAEAYHVQYEAFKKKHGWTKWRRFLEAIAKDFSGPIYGDSISYEDAIKKIIEE